MKESDAAHSEGQSAFMQVLENFYRFFLGSIAGGK